MAAIEATMEPPSHRLRGGVVVVVVVVETKLKFCGI